MSLPICEAPPGTAAFRDRRLQGLVVAALALSWTAALVWGLGVLWNYQRTPGEAAEPPSRWPAESSLPQPAGRPVVLQFIHPRCACSRASLVQLRELLGDLPEQPAVIIVFMRPGGVADRWERSENWNRATEIPGALVLVDAEGRESMRFGAQTSGQTLVYGDDGQLLFSGGLTAARGELGKSAGSDRVATVLGGMTPARRDSAVFGCPLHTHTESRE